MLMHYTVYEHDTHTRVTDVKSVTKRLNLNPVVRTCKAMTQNGNMCVWKPLESESYCRRHISLKYTTNHDEENVATQDFTHVTQTHNPITQRQIQNMKRVFIEDCFYYTDGDSVFDKSGVKVGYARKGGDREGDHKETMDDASNDPVDSLEYIITENVFELA
ncbi:hypothetical protein EB118_02065 [bacterium]|nr:hypothetical protein [bacterium]